MPIDEELIQILRPLAGKGAKVWFPFFANTFPLAFYAQTMGEEVVRDIWGTWNAFKENPADRVQVFYASKGEVDSLLTCSMESGVVLLDSCVSRYRPRWFFLEAATEIAKRVRDSHGTFTTNAADVLNWYNGIEIVTEIPSTAQVVEAFLSSFLTSPPGVRYVTGWAFDHALQQQRRGTLRVFFSGAPRTAVLRQQPQVYTRVDLPDDRFTAPLLDTHIVLAGKLPLDDAQALLAALESFHAKLFLAATEICMGTRRESEFRNLWRAYADIEQVEQNRPAFREPKDYATCLNDHHGARAEPPTEPLAFTATPPWHAHIGAGALGLGLVLPCLEHMERLVVLQRDGEKWRRLGPSGNITFSNSQHWSRQFSFVFIEPNEAPQAALQRIENLAGPLLVVTDHREVWRSVLGHATTITYSIKNGQAELGALLAGIPFTSPPTLYPFENVVDVGSLPPALPRAELAVDRVCAKAVIDAKTVRVECEQSGTIHYLLPDGVPDLPFGASSPPGIKVHRLKSIEEYRFYWRRKRYFVNGLHYVIAALSYDYLRDHGIGREHWEGHLVPVLTNLILGEEQRYAKLVDRFVEFQAVRLAEETDAAVVDALFGSREELVWQMSVFARQVLERVRSFIDRVGRVLPPDNPEGGLLKCREFLIESLRVMAEGRPGIAQISSPRGGALQDWFYAVTEVLEAVLLAQHSA